MLYKVHIHFLRKLCYHAIIYIGMCLCQTIDFYLFIILCLMSAIHFAREKPYL